MPLGSNRLNVRATARRHAKLVLLGRTKFKCSSRFRGMTPDQATECIVRFPVWKGNRNAADKTALALDAWIEANFPATTTQSCSFSPAQASDSSAAVAAAMAPASTCDTKAEAAASAPALSSCLTEAYARLDADEKMLTVARHYLEQLRCKKEALQKQADETLGAEVARKLAAENREIEALNTRIRALVGRSSLTAAAVGSSPT